MSELATTTARARLIREDAATDAEALDGTPITPQGLGPVFGNLLAMIAALAKCIEELCEARE